MTTIDPVTIIPTAPAETVTTPLPPSLPELIAIQITGLADTGPGGAFIRLDAETSDDNRIIAVTVTPFDFDIVGGQRVKVLLHVGPALPIEADTVAEPEPGEAA